MAETNRVVLPAVTIVSWTVGAEMEVALTQTPFVLAVLSVLISVRISVDPLLHWHSAELSTVLTRPAEQV